MCILIFHTLNKYRMYFINSNFCGTNTWKYLQKYCFNFLEYCVANRRNSVLFTNKLERLFMKFYLSDSKTYIKQFYGSTFRIIVENFP